MRYLVIECEDRLSGNCVTLCGVEVYSKTQERINYTPIKTYDSILYPSYWNDTIWCKTNLNNGNYNYTDNTSGQTVALAIMITPGGSGFRTGFNRVALDLNADVSIGEIRVFMGSPEFRIPRVLRVYETNTLDDAHISATRKMEGLKLLGEHTYTGTETTVQSYNGMNSKRYFLLKDNEGIKTIINNELVAVEGPLSEKLFEEKKVDIESIPSNILNKEGLKIISLSQNGITSITGVSRDTAFNKVNLRYEGAASLLIPLPDVESFSKTLSIFLKGKNLSAKLGRVSTKGLTRTLTLEPLGEMYKVDVSIENETYTESDPLAVNIEIANGGYLEAYAYSWL